MKPIINTELPGPNARFVIDIDNDYLSTSSTRPYPLVARSGKGCWVTDVDGNVFLDFAAGIATCSTGHCHPRVVDAIRDQAETLIHMSGTDFYYAEQTSLASRLSKLVPGDGAHRTFFSNSGTEAIEAAFKLARYYTGRKQFIAFNGAFHGRTMGALSLTASKTIQQRKFFPGVPGVIHVPYADCYRCVYGYESWHKCSVDCLNYIEDEVFKKIVSPEEIAAIFVEPIQGEGGYIVPPVFFHIELKMLAEKYDILYVADEVQTGMGRTGRMFATEYFNVVPDIIVLAKGIASGMPLGATVARAGIMEWESGAHASTFGGNPVSCQAARATIDVIEQESLIVKAEIYGNQLYRNLINLKDRYEFVDNVRGLGLMCAIDIVRSRETREGSQKLRDKIINAAFHKGLLLLGCGECGIRFSPSLVVREGEIDTCINILDDSMKRV